MRLSCVAFCFALSAALLCTGCGDDGECRVAHYLASPVGECSRVVNCSGALHSVVCHCVIDSCRCDCNGKWKDVGGSDMQRAFVTVAKSSPDRACDYVFSEAAAQHIACQSPAM